MALNSWPSTPAPWLISWTIWRFKGAVPADRPLSAPKEVPKYAWEFLKWCGWRRKGALPPRPDIVNKIPSWGWTLLKQLNQAVPLIPPPPPPPPPPPVPPNSWNLPNPIAWVAWYHMENPGSVNAHNMARQMQEAGVRTVAIQIGQAPSSVAPIYREYGHHIALWGIPSGGDMQALDEFDAEGFIPQVEGHYQYQDTINTLNEGTGAGLNLSIVTTLAGIETYYTRPDGAQTTAEAEALTSVGCTHAWVECYKQDGHFPVSRQMDSATRLRGIPHANPLVGLYWNVPISDYMPDLDPYGRQMGVYTCETMLPQDWIDLKNL